jgi:hypothetical protein
MKTTVLTMTLAAMCAWANAQSAWAQTNLTQPLNINLTATLTGPESTENGVTLQSVTNINLTSEDVIASLGTSLGTTFSSNAQLLLTASATGPLTVAVKDGTATAVDVTGVFYLRSGAELYRIRDLQHQYGDGPD